MKTNREILDELFERKRGQGLICDLMDFIRSLLLCSTVICFLVSATLRFISAEPNISEYGCVENVFDDN